MFGNITFIILIEAWTTVVTTALVKTILLHSFVVEFIALIKLNIFLDLVTSPATRHCPWHYIAVPLLIILIQLKWPFRTWLLFILVFTLIYLFSWVYWGVIKQIPACFDHLLLVYYQIPIECSVVFNIITHIRIILHLHLILGNYIVWRSFVL